MSSSGWLLQISQDKDSGGAQAIVKSKSIVYLLRFQGVLSRERCKGLA